MSAAGWQTVSGGPQAGDEWQTVSGGPGEEAKTSASQQKKSGGNPFVNFTRGVGASVLSLPGVLVDLAAEGAKHAGADPAMMESIAEKAREAGTPPPGIAGTAGDVAGMAGGLLIGAPEEAALKTLARKGALGLAGAYGGGLVGREVGGFLGSPSTGATIGALAGGVAAPTYGEEVLSSLPRGSLLRKVIPFPPPDTEPSLGPEVRGTEQGAPYTPIRASPNYGRIQEARRAIGRAPAKPQTGPFDIPAPEMVSTSPEEIAKLPMRSTVTPGETVNLGTGQISGTAPGDVQIQVGGKPRAEAAGRKSLIAVPGETEPIAHPVTYQSVPRENLVRMANDQRTPFPDRVRAIREILRNPGGVNIDEAIPNWRMVTGEPGSEGKAYPKYKGGFKFQK